MCGYRVVHIFVSAGLVVPLLVSSCKSTSSTTENQQSSRVESSSSSTPGKQTAEGQTARKWAHDAIGDPCRLDSQCPDYLRCLSEGTCRVPPAMTGETSQRTPKVIIREQSGAGSREVLADYWVEVADTAVERRQGLMHRKHMDSDWGMLFVYPDEALRRFWMKNTLISLDMLFIDEDGKIVRVIEEVEPETMKRRPSGAPARYVLEINAGEAGEHGIEAGDQVDFQNLP